MPVNEPNPAKTTPTRTAQPLVLSELDRVPAASAPLAMEAAATGAANPLHQIKTQLTVCVGHTELTVGELLGAREQQVLRLDHLIDQPVDILLEGQVVARGILVAVEEHFGVRITELPLPLKP